MQLYIFRKLDLVSFYNGKNNLKLALVMFMEKADFS